MTYEFYIDEFNGKKHQQSSDEYRRIIFAKTAKQGCINFCMSIWKTYSSHNFKALKYGEYYN